MGGNGHIWCCADKVLQDEEIVLESSTSDLKRFHLRRFPRRYLREFLAKLESGQEGGSTGGGYAFINSTGAMPDTSIVRSAADWATLDPEKQAPGHVAILAWLPNWSRATAEQVLEFAHVRP